MRLRRLILTCSLLIAPAPASLAAPESQPNTQALETIVDRHAAAHGLPREFARAIVQVESTWNPQLIGAAGEVGLMQIKFETARHLGYSGSRAALYDPDTNIKWGMRYLAGAWKLAEGDECGTVLRYQAGHGAKTMTGAAGAHCGKLRKFMVAAR